MEFSQGRCPHLFEGRVECGVGHRLWVECWVCPWVRGYEGCGHLPPAPLPSI